MSGNQTQPSAHNEPAAVKHDGPQFADLIARLEKATGPDWELDCLIHRAVTPALADTHPHSIGWLVGGDHAQPTKAPLYTASIDATLTLVPDRAEWQCGSAKLLAVYWAEVITPDQTFAGRGICDPAIALCIAALKARAASTAAVGDCEGAAASSERA